MTCAPTVFIDAVKSHFYSEVLILVLLVLLCIVAVIGSFFCFKPYTGTSKRRMWIIVLLACLGSGVLLTIRTVGFLPVYTDYKNMSYIVTTVAFAGTKENMELMLVICTQKSGGKNYLYASLDDEVSWHEWDFENINKFENNIVDHIANRVNRTIKTVTEVRNKYFRMASYYLNDDGEWVCFEDDCPDTKWFCSIVSRLTQSGEIIKTYRLEN